MAKKNVSGENKTTVDDKEKKKSSVAKSDEGEVSEVKADSEEAVSEGTDVKVDEVENVPEEKAESARPKPVPKGSRRGSKAIQVELDKYKELAQGNEEKYKRLLAEFENARQRTEKEGSKMFDLGAKDVLEKLLPIVDNFERALASIPEEDIDRAFEQGVDKIYRQLMVTLEGIGVTPMDAEGKEFNPELHNAVIHVEDESLGENVVAEEMQKGYMYKDQVLRHSMVKVAN
ncbi:MAG: nucleotide exchange factor GrpE [Lachnospiraceae bacterium]|nr:nucleotide exchange factor GrpE [Lachnospiraceae bacterium]MBR1816244.1 nucleotide exchange factor GrpE [Lachnospiraceae bacterium]